MNVQDQIRQAAAKEYGWVAAELRVDELPTLKRGSCSFHTAANTQRPVAFMPTYATVGGAVLGPSDPKAVATILASCGKDAPATWLAEVLTRFQLAGLQPVLTEADNPTGAREVKQRAGAFTPPTLSGATVTFFAMEPEAFLFYRVTATRQADGGYTVEKTSL